MDYQHRRIVCGHQTDRRGLAQERADTRCPPVFRRCTEELRERIRQTLADFIAAFASGGSANPFLQSLIERHQGAAPDVLARAGLALSNFDEAPIFTIHGFCQRQLRDRVPFATVTSIHAGVVQPDALIQRRARRLAVGSQCAGDVEENWRQYQAEGCDTR